MTQRPIDPGSASATERASATMAEADSPFGVTPQPETVSAQAPGPLLDSTALNPRASHYLKPRPTTPPKRVTNQDLYRISALRAMLATQAGWCCSSGSIVVPRWFRWRKRTQPTCVRWHSRPSAPRSARRPVNSCVHLRGPNDQRPVAHRKAARDVQISDSRVLEHQVS
jgi:hypothetical protein